MTKFYCQILQYRQSEIIWLIVIKPVITARQVSKGSGSVALIECKCHT